MAQKFTLPRKVASCKIPGGNVLWIWQGDLDHQTGMEVSYLGGNEYKKPEASSVKESSRFLVWQVTKDGTPTDNEEAFGLVYTQNNPQLVAGAKQTYYFDGFQEPRIEYDDELKTLQLWVWANVFTPAGGVQEDNSAEYWQTLSKEDAGWDCPTYEEPCGGYVDSEDFDDNNFVIQQHDPRDPNERRNLLCTRRVLFHAEGNLVPLKSEESDGIYPIFKKPVPLYITPIEDVDTDRFGNNMPLPAAHPEEFRIMQIQETGTGSCETGCVGSDYVPGTEVSAKTAEEADAALNPWRQMRARDIDTPWGENVFRFEEGQKVPVFIGEDGSPVVFPSSGEILKAVIVGMTDSDAVGDYPTQRITKYIVDVVDFADGLNHDRLHHIRYCDVRDPFGNYRKFSPKDLVEIRWDRYVNAWAIISRDVVCAQVQPGSSSVDYIQVEKITQGECRDNHKFEHTFKVDDRYPWAEGECVLLLEEQPEDTSEVKSAFGVVKSVTLGDVVVATGCDEGTGRCDPEVIPDPITTLSYKDVTLTVEFDAWFTVGTVCDGAGSCVDPSLVCFTRERSRLCKTSCISEITGPTGPTGPTSPTGPTGPTGPTSGGGGGGGGKLSEFHYTVVNGTATNTIVTVGAVADGDTLAWSDVFGPTDPTFGHSAGIADGPVWGGPVTTVYFARVNTIRAPIGTEVGTTIDIGAGAQPYMNVYNAAAATLYIEGGNLKAILPPNGAGYDQDWTIVYWKS